ncbi:MAG: recombination protein RecR [Bacteroidetes bacterium GWA2_30_7]|nr:MAG: recombination protein RecR [Bacteroidetes bacterium GWA2_30_7]
MDENCNTSLILDNAVNELSKLPGIGRKTATRLILHLIKQPQNEISALGNAVIRLSNEIKYCKSCHNITDNDFCHVCANPSRDKSVVCIVESIKDVIAIENTRQFKGIYHVLGGLISPMDGVGPNDLFIETIEKKVISGSVNEIIFALSPTMEGDTTNYYLFKKLNKYNLNFSILARGISFGDEIEYTDEITLGRSIINRTPFETAFSR